LIGCTGRLGLCAFFGACSELWQFSISEPLSPQPPVTPAVGRFVPKLNRQGKNENPQQRDTPAISGGSHVDIL